MVWRDLAAAALPWLVLAVVLMVVWSIVLPPIVIGWREYRLKRFLRGLAEDSARAVLEPVQVCPSTVSGNGVDLLRCSLRIDHVGRHLANNGASWDEDASDQAWLQRDRQRGGRLRDWKD